MKKQTFYAVVRKNRRKYNSELRCPTIASHLPIYWLKKIAKEHCFEGHEVVKVSLKLET